MMVVTPVSNELVFSKQYFLVFMSKNHTLIVKTLPSKSCKTFRKNSIDDYIYLVAHFHKQMIYNFKDAFKNLLYLVCVIFLKGLTLPAPFYLPIAMKIWQFSDAVHSSRLHSFRPYFSIFHFCWKLFFVLSNCTMWRYIRYKYVVSSDLITARKW